MSERIKAKKSPWYITALFILVIVLLSPLILLVILIFLIPWLNIRYIQRPRLLRRVKNEWLPNDKYILFVYSDNELWKEYAEGNIIPKIKSHAVILNWSERKNWINTNTLEAQLFKNFQWRHEWIWQQNLRMGGQNYNHMAIVFKPWYRPKIINFWKAFKDYEFGKGEQPQLTEEELYRYL
jgi:hypothetical protein